MAQYQFGSFDHRGSLLRIQPQGAAGQGKIGIPWLRYVHGTTTGGTGLSGSDVIGTTQLSTARIGLVAGSKQLYLAALGLTTAKVAAVQLTISEVFDIDLTQPIYFDNTYTCVAATTVGSTLAAAWKYNQYPINAVGAGDLTIDAATAFTAGSATWTVAAADIESYTTVTGAYIGGGVLTNNARPLYFQFTTTLVTATANQISLMETNIRYTKRFL